MQRVLLLIPSSSYRASAYVEAARRLGVELTVGSDHRQALEGRAGGRSVALPFTPVGEGVARILEFAERHPMHAVVGTDDETIVLAAAAARALKLLHNSPESVACARDKFRFRQALARGGLRSPWFRRVSLGGDLVALARSIAYPCVLKPLALSASRGVIRADDGGEFVKACTRIGRILRDANHARIAPSADSILAEGFIPGREVALEGLLERGRLRPLALFDKPDPLDGPFFEETLYVTPSRLPDALQAEVAAEAERAARALGLREGPVHAELRVNESGAWMIEIAPRTIGGLCSRALRFAPETMLEELVLRHALGRSVDDLVLRAGAAGVMMIPIPRAGWLRGIGGIEGARAMAAIEDVVPSIPVGDWVQPLPEGDRYLGFIFARAGTPDEVEAALRAAHARLLIDIEAEAQAARRSPG
ncbi:MAG: ATP-grasp domain-containing protein [Burkholderiales bacterium]|nr:ATP-grasp domain-containing protein [Burkholderiales bacterium]